jgi:putative membrane protein
MKSVLGFVLAGAVVVSPVAFSQGANPAGANPATPEIETGSPAEDMVNVQDTNFLRQLSNGNTAEVQLGNLAADRAAAASVQDFAQRMISDHEMAQNRLEMLAGSKEVPLPTELDPDQRAVSDRLQELEGEAFDVDYIRAQLVAHQRAALLIQYQIGLGQSEEVRSYAKETLVNVLRHLEAARSIHAELTGAAP